jgi:hypothetical protein
MFANKPSLALEPHPNASGATLRTGLVMFEAQRFVTADWAARTFGCFRPTSLPPALDAQDDRRQFEVGLVVTHRRQSYADLPFVTSGIHGVCRSEL